MAAPKSLRSFNPSVIYGHDSVTSSRYVEGIAGGTMPTIASKRRSSFGTDCVQCGNELIAPERSEYRDERHVLHIWRCPKCDRSFEVIWSADLKSVTDISAFLIVLSAPISMKAAMAKLIIIIMTAALLTQNCYAQAGGGGSGGGRKQHQQKADKPASQTPKADEKAYNAALKSLPDKPFDPWRGAR